MNLFFNGILGVSALAYILLIFSLFLDHRKTKNANYRAKKIGRLREQLSAKKFHHQNTCSNKKTMTKEELIQFIRDYDEYFIDTPLEKYSVQELELIKFSIDAKRRNYKARILC